MTLYNKVKLNFTRLFNILKGIRKKDSFAQNFSFTFSGNLISILLSLIFAPILSRIYPPESYGTFSVYNAIITNVSTFSLLTYNVALILPKEERKFNNLLRLTFLLTIIFSAISFLITLVFTSTILSTFSMKRIGALIYLLAPAIFLLGIGTILSQWLTRDKQFRKLTIVSSSNNLVTKIITLGLGYLSQGNVLGFITGDFLNKVISVLFLFNKKIWKSLKILISKFNLLEIISTAKEFKKYPLLVLPGEYINMFSEQLPIYLISIYFGSKELGYFAFATSILGMPMGLLGNAVRPVFFQKASTIYNEDKKRLGEITADLFKYLFIIGVIPFSILTVFGDVIFGLIFGSNWIQAGLFAGILGYFYIFRLISSPISSVLWVVKKEKAFFLFQIFLFTTRLLSLLMGIYFFNNIVTTLILFSLANTVNYLILTVFVLKILELNYMKISVITVTIILGIFAILYLIKFNFYNILR